MERTSINLCFKSDIYLLNEMLRLILSFVEENYPDIAYDDVFDLRLIYNELLLNAITHGNNSNPAKDIYVSIEAVGDCVRSSVRDEGSGFDHKKTMLELDIPIDPLSESGRGIRIIRSLANSLTFDGEGNTITFTKSLSPQTEGWIAGATALAIS